MSKLETVDDLGAIHNGLFYGRSMNDGGGGGGRGGGITTPPPRLTFDKETVES